MREGEENKKDKLAQNFILNRNQMWPLLKCHKLLTVFESKGTVKVISLTTHSVIIKLKISPTGTHVYTETEIHTGPKEG